MVIIKQNTLLMTTFIIIFSLLFDSFAIPISKIIFKEEPLTFFSSVGKEEI